MSDLPNVLVQIDIPAACVPSTFTQFVSPSNPAVVPLCHDAMHKCQGNSTATQIHVQALNPVADVLHVILKDSQIVDAADEAMMVLPVSHAGTSHRLFTYGERLDRWTATAVDNGTAINFTDCGGLPAVTPPLAAGETFSTFCGSFGLCPPLPARDYTGDLLVSGPNQRFVVSSGSHCRVVPEDVPLSCESLVEMQWPYAPDDSRYTDHLVTEFNKRFQDIRAGDLFRIVAMEGNVDVDVAGIISNDPEPIHGKSCAIPTTHLANAGDWCEINMQGGGRIHAQLGKKIQVAQYMKTNMVTTTGDPAMMLIVPTVRFACAHRFFSFGGFNDNPPVTPPNNGTFVNVVAPSGTMGSIRIDGALLSATCIGGFAPVAIPLTTYSWVQCRLPDPPYAPPAVIGQEHHIQGIDAAGNPVPIAVYAYGQTSLDGAYAYPTNLGFEIQ